MIKSSICSAVSVAARRQMQPKPTTPVSDNPQAAAAFALSSTDFLSASTEQEVIRIAAEVISKTCRPSLFYIAYSRPDADNRFTIETGSTLQEEQIRPISEFLEGVLLSGIGNVSETLFDSFPILKNIPRYIGKPSSGSMSRCLMLVFGAQDARTSAAPLTLIHKTMEAQLERLHLRQILETSRATLANLHQNAEASSLRPAPVAEFVRTACENAQKVLAETRTAILGPTDETHTAFRVLAQNGFTNDTVPLPPALFAGSFSEFRERGRNGIVYQVHPKDQILLVPLFVRREPSSVLVFFLPPESDRLTRDQIQMAEVYGDWVSVTLESLMLFERITANQREWENTFDSIADPIYIIDTDYRLKKINRSLAAFTMADVKIPLDRNCYRYLFRRETICPWCPVPRVSQSGQAVTVEASIFPGGLWQMQAFPNTDASGKRVGSIHVLRDITQLKSVQEQLIESEKLASTGKLISGVAHEVRNPLFGISTTVRALANELGNKEELKPFLDIITSETARLNRLMEDLLSYSRPVQIDKNPSNLSEIVNEVLEEFRQIMPNTEMSLNLYVSDEIPPLNVDRNKLKQVLINLIENGIQHCTVIPRIDVFLQYLSLANPPEIHIVVKDNGSGISTKNLSKIFDPFFTTRQKGTGLGLSIVRKVIHDHGGRISVESAPGHGTTFRISIPYKPQMN